MAGGPGGHEVERISVKVVPDTSGFAEKLKKFLERQEKTNEVSIEVDVDTKKAEAKLKKLAKDLKVKITASADTAKAEAKLKALGKNVTAKVKADVDDLKAKTELDVLSRDRKVNIKADVDKSAFGRITSAFSNIGKVVSGLGKGAFQLITGNLRGISTATNAVKQGFSGLGSTITVVGNIASAVLYGEVIGALAGVVAAAAAVAGALALAFAPAAFIGAGVAFALLAGKSNAMAKKIKKDFESVKKTALSVVSSAVQPMLKALDAQLPQINHWIATLKGPLKTAFSDASTYIDTFARGAEEFFSQALKGIVTALENPNLKPAVDGVRTLLGDAGKAIGDFFAELAKFGPDFGSTLDALGVQLPPIAKAFADLLGAFATISPDLITQMGQGIVQILRAFSDPNVIKGLAFISKLSFAAIIGQLQLTAAAIALVSETWDALKSATSATISILKSGWNGLKSFLSSLWSGIKGAASAAWNEIKNLLVGIALGIYSGISGAITRLKNALSGLWNGIKGTAVSVAGSMASSVTGKFNSIKSSASSIVSSIKGFFSSMGSYVGRVVSGIRSSVSTILGLVSKARSAISKLPFFATFEYGDPPNGPDPKKLGFPVGFGPGGSMAVGSLQGDLRAMASEASKINDSSLKSVKFPKPSSKNSAGVAQKVYSFGDIISNEKTTPEAITNALTRLDALYS
jgi:phage-related protein